MGDWGCSMESRTPPSLAKQPNFFADTSLPSYAQSSAPATPSSSRRHKGPHRDGFSVKKCRDVLVRQCSWIPRNYNFKDGVNQVYEVLREYLGDENLDLAIAQLNELIEVPSRWLHDEGASFQAWKHDYMLRHKDLENSHVPRLRNIIVAPINPTERLKKWREEHLDRDHATLSNSQSSQTPSNNSDIRPVTPDYRIGTRARGGNWRLENALFVSSRAQGTRVLHCPSPQELHKKTWNEEFGRGGKLVQERVVNLGELVDNIEQIPDQVLPLKTKKSFADLRSMRSFVDVPVLQRCQSLNFVSEKLNTSFGGRLFAPDIRKHQKQANKRKRADVRAKHYHSDPLLERSTVEVKIYESSSAVRDLPDPESDIGKSYYSNILTWPLPRGMIVPSPRFARKHGLVPVETPLPGGVVIKLVPTADEVAIEKSFPDPGGSSCVTGLSGPFTPELFKDSGIDFPRHWGYTELVQAGSKLDTESLSDMGALGDAAQSPSKRLQSISDNIPASSSISNIVGPNEEHQVCVPNVPARHPPSKDCIVASAASALKGMVSYRREWHSFTWKRYSESTFSDAASLTAVYCDPHSVPRYLLRDLIKAFQQTISKPLHPQLGMRQKLASLSKQQHSLTILSPPKQCNLGSAIAILAKNCAMMELNNTIDPSIIAFNRCGISAANEIEANEKPGSSLLKVIPEITVNSPVDHPKDHLMHRYDSRKVYAGQKYQRHKIAPHKTGIGFQAETAINDLNFSGIKGHTDGEFTARLALEVLQETDYFYSEAMLNSSSSGAKRYRRVVNNNEAGAMSKSANNSKISATDSLRGILALPLKLIHENSEITQGWQNLQKDLEMDLNRDLPPLPLATDSQFPQLTDQFQQHSLEPAAGCIVDFLRPLSYDPIRDSQKYGGIHYHTDGMRFHPEILQHPPRTSSMQQTVAPLEATRGSNVHQVMIREHLHPSCAANIDSKDIFESTRASDADYCSEGSSGIMGNFIPVKILSPSSVMLARAVHLPRIETNYSKRTASQKCELKTTYDKGSFKDVTQCHETEEKTSGSHIKNLYSVSIQHGLGPSNLPNKDHESIDLSDPEALAKYIRQLKKMKKQPTKAEKHAFAPESLLSRNFDGEAGRYVDYNDADDHTVVDSDEDVEAPYFPVQDYSEIRAGNPFELEHDELPNDPDRITTFTDFMGGAQNMYKSSNTHKYGKKGHFKNSHSESNVFSLKKRPEPIQIVQQNSAARQVLQRSDSSPNISPMRIATRRNAAETPLQPFHKEGNRSYYQTVNRGREVDNRPRSPMRGHGFPRSSSIQLDEVPENHEATFDTPSPIQKRPWSPVKMIFGEGRWLGSTAGPKDDSPTPKKPGLVEKIKLKIEEIGLKADLRPIKYPFRNDQEKCLDHSTFPISINPARQAELYLDIELLICDSANTFLMNEFHSSRMSVDSLKKVTDFWKGKGRPQVLEFHYDQSTQRDLIVANQKTFCFYGPNANDPLKVHAMLYAWKTNAREMAVRTFCYPDSMIRKHVRDAFVILDFLGGHPFQYIAAHEVQKKLVRWIDEALNHATIRSSGPRSVQSVGRRSNESPRELVRQNSWHSASKSTKRSSRQGDSSQLTT